MQIIRIEMVTLATAKHQLAETALTRHQRDYDGGFIDKRRRQRTVGRRHSPVRAEATRDERSLTARNRVTIIIVIHEDLQKVTADLFRDAISGFIVQTQNAACFVHEENRGSIRLE